jgi:photosystem II stability/assembly factor-like uncharacterized protein
MIAKDILPVLILSLILSACSTQAGLVTPSMSTVTDASVSASPSSEPTLIDTPIPSATIAPISLPLPVLASPVLARIDFQDENSGWGIAVNDKGYVVRSVDGGRTWLNGTPPEPGALGFSATLTVLNVNTAWVLVPGIDFFSGTLFRTKDGGITWNSAPVPFGGGFLQFLDANNGRALAAREARAGSEAVEIFKTSDGGLTWASVYHNDSSQPGSSDGLPLVGIKNGMTFLDANTGWVTGSNPVEGDVYLYATHDGGISWAQQSLSLAANSATFQFLPQAPVFFGKDGFLPLMIYRSGRTDFTFYSTHDSGLTWSGDPTDAKKIIKPGVPALADAIHIWSWDGGANLYLSTDGAQSWKATPTSLDLSGRLFQLQIVPSPSGRFTGWALTRVDDAGHSQLYRTTDGSTWTPLIP